jgi:hypothetical protein
MVLQLHTLFSRVGAFALNDTTDYRFDCHAKAPVENFIQMPFTESLFTEWCHLEASSHTFKAICYVQSKRLRLFSMLVL